MYCMKISGWITKKPSPPPVFIEYNAVHIVLRKYAICVMGGGPRHVTIPDTVPPYQDMTREKFLGVKLLLFVFVTFGQF